MPLIWDNDNTLMIGEYVNTNNENMFTTLHMPHLGMTKIIFENYWLMRF